MGSPAAVYGKRNEKLIKFIYNNDFVYGVITLEMVSSGQINTGIMAIHWCNWHN